MKIKRMISLLLVFIIAAALASGCARTPGETQNHVQDNPETRIENLDIPELWKQELQHAIALGLPADKLEQDNISGTSGLLCGIRRYKQAGAVENPASFVAQQQ